MSYLVVTTDGVYTFDDVQGILNAEFRMKMCRAFYLRLLVSRHDKTLLFRTRVSRITRT